MDVFNPFQYFLSSMSCRNLVFVPLPFWIIRLILSLHHTHRFTVIFPSNSISCSVECEQKWPQKAIPYYEGNRDFFEFTRPAQFLTCIVLVICTKEHHWPHKSIYINISKKNTGVWHDEVKWIMIKWFYHYIFIHPKPLIWGPPMFTVSFSGQHFHQWS